MDQQAAKVEEVYADAEAGVNAEQNVELAGYRLAGYYTGLERVFEFIALRFDNSPIEGANWHTDLLLQMSLPMPGKRPPVISVVTEQVLEEVLKFRHVMRSAYALELDLGQIARLAPSFRTLVPRIRDELRAFADFLDALGAGTEST